MAGELRSGAVVAFPTETFYALGADPRSPEAVAEVFRLKGRPGTAGSRGSPPAGRRWRRSVCSPNRRRPSRIGAGRVR